VTRTEASSSYYIAAACAVVSGIVFKEILWTAALWREAMLIVWCIDHHVTGIAAALTKHVG